MRSSLLTVVWMVVAMALAMSTGCGNSGGTDKPPLPPLIRPIAQPGDCGLDSPAFCETFETASPGGRGGDLDEKVWSFARWGHETRQHFVRNPVGTVVTRVVDGMPPAPAALNPQPMFPSVLCGQTFSGVLMPNDVVVCNGAGVDGTMSHQLNEVYDDQGDFAINSFRSRQLFDFTDRTGTVVFDVDAKVNPLNLGHGWWVEFWITDDPAPMPYHEAPGVLSYPRNGVGINFQGLNSCPQGRSATQISRVFVTKNYEILHDYMGWTLQLDSDTARCITIADQKLNRFKIMISKDQAEIWASDAGDTNLHRIATAPMLDLPFTRGYIHLQHSQYNGLKDGPVTPVQTYRWDNIGFDGPTYAIPRAYEFPDNNLPDIDGAGGRVYGYPMNDKDWTTLQLDGVDLSGAAKATLSMTAQVILGDTIEYNFNGGPPHSYTITAPKSDGRDGLRGLTIDVPLAELKSGANTFTFKIAAPQKYGAEAIGNLELTLEPGN